VSHIVSWGIPAILVTIGTIATRLTFTALLPLTPNAVRVVRVALALGAQQFEARAAGHNCFVVSPWDWGLFYAPICLNLAIGTTLMVIAIIKVLRVTHRTHIPLPLPAWKLHASHSSA